MDGMKYSAAVERLIEAAHRMCGPVLSADSFILALSKSLAGFSDDDACDPELLDAGKVFEEECLDLHAMARAILENTLGRGGRPPADGEFHMQTCMFSAECHASSEGRDVISVRDAVKGILGKPNDDFMAYRSSAYFGDMYLDMDDLFIGEEDFSADDETADSVNLEIIEEMQLLDRDAFSEDDIFIPDIESLIEENSARIEQLSSLPRDDRDPFRDAKLEIDSLVGKIKSIRRQLLDNVFGQNNAINTFVTGFNQACMLSLLDSERRQPGAVFLFAGPPGVGKTYLAETAARLLDLPFRRFDMSEYADKEANIEFCGSDKVYKDAKAGNVTSFVEENPRCVLLFDEIEKAHSCAIHLFLQMLDAGRLRDNYTDNEVSFRDAIIIFTTNAGRQLYDDHETGDFSLLPRKVIVRALQKDVNPETGAPFFPAAMCSRFASGNIVMFNHVMAHHLRDIARRELDRQSEMFRRKTGIRITIDDHVCAALLFAEGGAADARTVRSRAEHFFNDELFELLRLVSSDKSRTDIEHLEKIRVTVDLSKADSRIRDLYLNTERTQVLVFASEETAAACAERLPDCTVMAAQTEQGAMELVKNHCFDLALVDIRFGVDSESAHQLNIEDVDSEARSFMRLMRELHSELALYILEQPSSRLTNEEKHSFRRQGIRDIITMPRSRDGLSREISRIAGVLHQQRSMRSLARENKTVAFETAQTVSRSGKSATISLFDFSMKVAVDSEDSRSVLSAMSRPDVHFEDVIGAEEAKKELSYFVEYLKNPRKYIGTGVKAPKGVLMYGPPGTGKTMLAKAMACESDVTFIAAEGNQFLRKFVGEGAEQVHELFRTARKYAPTVLFVDEIEAIGKERSGSPVQAGGEETLTAFLTEMDGFASDPSKPVFVLAATNFDVQPGSGKSLDPALMRRFDRRVYIDLPNKADRRRFLTVMKSRNPALRMSEDKIDNIALRATGMSLAELDSVVELALRSAIRDGSTVVSDDIFEDAFETFTSGEEKAWDVSQLERVARHEAGHAFVCWHSGQTPSYLTVVARGNHGGYMQSAEQEGKALFTRDELLARIRTALGGRAAEMVYYGEKDGLSTGAGADLSSATATARNIICAYGMDDTFGLAVMDRCSSDSGMPADVRQAVNRILADQLDEAVRIIEENRHKIDALVAQLMDRNHMSGPEIDSVLRNA